ncbi:MAG TPA: site-specific integrase, partial [Dermatophilaceae bacterium]|nr:site-specific integrase [Dermatophilaceae bacterium]
MTSPAEARSATWWLPEFRTHLATERGLSEHTCRAYLADVSALAGFLHGERPNTHPGHSGGQSIVATPGDVTLADLRAWLASLA